MKKTYNKQEIAQLLDKFMAGETSLNEEQMLATYFRTHEVDEEWKEYKEMFALFDSGQVDIERPTQTRLPLRWLMTGIAASIMLLIGFSLLMKEGKTNEDLPEIAQQMPQQSTSQPAPQLVVEEKKEKVVAEMQPKKKTAKKRRNVVRKKSTPIEEPLLAEAGPITEVPAREYSDVIFSDPSNPYQLAVAQLQDLRSRGERLDREVAMLMQH